MGDIFKIDQKLLDNISLLIKQTQQRVASTVNSAMVLLYWNIGKTIKEDIVKNKRADYGKAVIEEISNHLSLHFGKGYSRSNLSRMVDFYTNFNNLEICATLSQKLSWSHIVEINKQKDELKREFYLTMCINENWSVRQLSERIDSMLFERTAISKKPEETIKEDLAKLRDEKEMSVELFLRDPYMLDFLGLQDKFNEKDLEQSIINELQKFILEMGNDFAFLARQKRITIDNNDYYIDLLFYHRKLKRLVVIELKLGKFKHEYKSQLELYLRWLDKYEKQDGENTPLGLLLCAEKEEEIIELLELDKSGIHVATYLTELPPKELLKLKLIESIKTAKQLLNQKIK